LVTPDFAKIKDMKKIKEPHKNIIKNYFKKSKRTDVVEESTTEIQDQTQNTENNSSENQNTEETIN